MQINNKIGIYCSMVTHLSTNHFKERLTFFDRAKIAFFLYQLSLSSRPWLEVVTEVVLAS